MPAIPGYTRGIVQQAQIANTVNPSAISDAASGFNAAAQGIGAAAQVSMKIKEADDKASLNEIVLTREREKIDFYETAKKNYEGKPDGYATFIEAEMKRKDEGIKTNLPPDLQKAFSKTVMEYNVRDYKENLNWETERKIAVVGDKLGRSAETVSSLAYEYARTGKSFNELVPQMDATLIAGDGTIDNLKLGEFDDKMRSEAAKNYLTGLQTRDPQAAQELLNSGDFSQYLKPDDLMKASKAIWDATPDIMKLEALQGQGVPGGPQNLRAVIERSEGGFVPTDGASGQPAIYGINKGSFPKEFIQAQKITQEQGEQAGKDYAWEFYQKEFIKPNGIDKLRPEVQDVVADGVVNHWSGFRAKLLAAAKDGASRDELIEMRRDEYQRLGAKKEYAPSLKGWMQRLDNLQGGGTGTAYDTMSPGERMGEKYKIQKNIRDDSAMAAQQYGATTPDQMVAIQGRLGIPPRFAQVINKDDALQMMQEVSQFENGDDVIAFVSKISEEYGPYKTNALQDLRQKSDMKPATEAALDIASLGVADYKQHVDLLFKAGKFGDDVVGKAFTNNGYKAAQINENVQTKFLPYLTAMQNEGDDGVEDRRNVIIALAKSRMNQTLDGDYSEAVEFALQPISERYAIRQSNGVEFRVPMQHQPDAVENAVDDIISKNLKEMVKDSGNDAYRYNGEVKPFLSPDEDGIMFRDMNNETLVDKAGQEILFTFQEMMTKEAIKKGEREEVRRKIRMGINKYQGPLV